MNDNLLSEIDRLVAEFDATQNKGPNENRLYYNADGTIIGLWNNDYPNSNNYIVLDDLKTLNSSNTQLLRVQNKKLVVLDAHSPAKSRLKKSSTGFRVVKGHAALILEHNETYPDVEHYDRTNN